MHSILGILTPYSIGFLALTAIYQALYYFLRNGQLPRFAHLTKEKRKQLKARASFFVFVGQIFLWTTPFYVFVIPYLLSIFGDFQFLQTTVFFVVIWLNFFELFIYEKWLANALASFKDAIPADPAA